MNALVTCEDDQELGRLHLAERAELPNFAPVVALETGGVHHSSPSPLTQTSKEGQTKL